MRPFHSSKLRAAAAGATAALLLAACGGDETPAPGDDPVARALTPEEREQLAALGYVYFAEEEAAEGDGVVRHDPARAFPGYSLYSIRYRCRAELIDMDGTVVNAWEHRPCRFWSTAELLPSGDLLVTGQDPRPEGEEGLDEMYLLRLAWDGSVRWKARIPAHHDAELTPRGEILTVVARYRRVPAVYPDAWVKDELLTLLDPEDGSPIEERSVLAMLQRGGEGMLPIRRVGERERHGRTEVELFHANSVEWIDRPALAGRHPVYAAGNVLTCLRNQDVIGVFDWEARRPVWLWGRGELELPHHPTLLESGNVLVFDNGFRTGRSRVLEVDPRTDAIVWQYVGSEAEPFFTKNRGSAQRLPNGNTLVADSDSGRAFEVTREGEIVWEFLAPYRNDEGHRATIERIQRHPPEAIEPLLEAAR